jgi:para-aminobenzoate synthetase / 4-amino-4-deoxychorismate lyase
LAASTRELFGADPPPDAADVIREAARPLELGRLRLDATPDLGTSVKVAEVEPAAVFPAWERAVELAEVVVPSGIGGHKWSDRRLLDQAQAELGEAVPLVVDDDGTVLEVSRGNVFAVRGGALVTPPADGRILPGVARARVVDVAQAAGLPLEERAVSREELASADEVFVSGSVRGVEPVRAYAGARWEPGPVTPGVAAGLRRLWLGAQKPDYTRAP